MNIRQKWNNYYLNKCLQRLDNLSKEKIFIAEKNSDIFNKDLKNYDALVLVEPLNQTFDLISFFNYLKNSTNSNCKIFFFYFSKRWYPLFILLELFKITKKLDHDEFSYIDSKKINLFLNLCDYSTNTTINVSNFLFKNKFINFFLDAFNTIFPFFDLFSFCQIKCVSLINHSLKKNYKTSVIIPCRNEMENIPSIFDELKKIESNFEAVFVDDQSTDKTKENILEEINKNNNLKIKLIAGEGINKYRAVRKGVLNSTNDICIILDADLAVKAAEVNKCVKLMEQKNFDMINCSRFIYRQKNFSMRFLNFFGNKFFSLLFSLIVKDNVTDTLCGTKAFRRSDWRLFENFANKTKNFDKWGDFNIIFGSFFYGLKVQEMPVRYYPRVSGSSKMTNRLKRFYQMILACFFAFLTFNN